MNIFKPNDLLNIGKNFYNLNAVKADRSNNSLDVKQTDKLNNLPEGLIDSLKQWELEDRLDQLKKPRWDLARIPLQYYVSNGSNIDGYKKEFEKVISNCFTDWSRASFGKIRFTNTVNESTADIVIKWAETVVLGRQYECGHNNLRVIGNNIDHAEISLIVYPLIDKLTPGIDRVERIRRTLLHEVGHALGLNHSESHKDIMFHRAIKNRQISENDSNILIELYNKKQGNEFIM